MKDLLVGYTGFRPDNSERPDVEIPVFILAKDTCFDVGPEISKGEGMLVIDVTVVIIFPDIRKKPGIRISIGCCSILKLVWLIVCSGLFRRIIVDQPVVVLALVCI